MKKAASPLLAFLTLCLALSASLQAQITDLASFTDPNGANPEGSLTLSRDGSTFYGTASSGGANSDGIVFSVPVGGGSPTVLANFDGAHGSGPRGSLTLSQDGSTLYGITANGGAINYGVVFSLPVGGGTPTVLASFNNGLEPDGGLTLSGNTFYGTTVVGGAGYGYGTVFSVPMGGGTPAFLTSFTNTDGANPSGSLTLVGSVLYGTTQQGGPNHYGEVFSLPVGGGTPTILAAFNSADGAYPRGNLTLIGSTLYGTTSGGGANNDGTVFSVPIGGGTPTVLASFNNTNGADPEGSLTLSQDGSTFFGTTRMGGMIGSGSAYGYGVVFSVPVGGSTPTVLGSFNGTNGADPFSDLTLSQDGSTLYGTTYTGGGNGGGTVFSVPATAAAPEPGSAGLLLTGLFVAIARRRHVGQAAARDSHSGRVKC